MKNLRTYVILVASIFSFGVSLQREARPAVSPRVVAQTPTLASSATPRAAVAENHARPSLPTPISDASLSARPKLMASYYALPLSFEENRSSANPSDRFVARGPGYSLFLTPAQASLVLESRPKESPAAALQPVAMTAELTRPVKTSSIRLQLLGANASASLTGLDQAPGRSQDGENLSRHRLGVLRQPATTRI
jgi:hypothetical protein